MTWLQIILLCVGAEVVAITLVIGLLSAALTIAHALEELADDGVTSVIKEEDQRHGEWFRNGGQG